MIERPWTFDPFAWGYCDSVNEYLKRSELLHVDLAARLRAASEKCREGDNTPAMTTYRVSWACYVSANLVLERLDPVLVQGMASPEDRPVLDDHKLSAFESALRAAVEASNVEVAEHEMTDSGRSASQLQGTRALRMKALVSRSLELISRARLYFQTPVAAQKEKWAQIVGHDFYYFLLDVGKTTEELVEFAERMSEVHV